jgi:hypothetical protein
MVQKEKNVRRTEFAQRKRFSPVNTGLPKTLRIGLSRPGGREFWSCRPRHFSPPCLAFPSMVESIFVGVPLFFVNFQIESKKYFIFLSKKIR